MRVLAPNPDGIAVAAESLRAGGIVAYPTETVYGLGVDPLNEAALTRLFEVKGRDQNQPVLVVIGALAQLDAFAEEVSPRARTLIDRFWPGPLTIVFPARRGLPSRLLGGSTGIAVRWTSCAIAARLCVEFGYGIVSTSANVHGSPPATCVDAIALPGIDVAIDGGELAPSAPSTVYDPETNRVLREGAITAQGIAHTLAL